MSKNIHIAINVDIDAADVQPDDVVNDNNRPSLLSSDKGSRNRTGERNEDTSIVVAVSGMESASAISGDGRNKTVEGTNHRGFFDRWRKE